MSMSRGKPVVVTSQSEYNDRDSSIDFYYSGTYGEAPPANDTITQLTNATKTLIMTMSRRKPVRVIRMSLSENKRLYASFGYRYDDNPNIAFMTKESFGFAARVRDGVGVPQFKAGYAIEAAALPGDNTVYHFKLVCDIDDGQFDLAAIRNRPTPDEYPAYQALTFT
ncbi:hypothetical protein BDD12DRAFT_801105 [Trichophaea hybrida]|nr:hypothetical protein BDD12DRAFT_801105 [Trichophaea hybrida]